MAFTYVNACVAVEDYEATIGALERMLFYAPDDIHVKAQRGFLYYRLKSHRSRHDSDAKHAPRGFEKQSRPLTFFAKKGSQEKRVVGSIFDLYATPKSADYSLALNMVQTIKKTI